MELTVYRKPDKTGPHKVDKKLQAAKEDAAAKRIAQTLRRFKRDWISDIVDEATRVKSLRDVNAITIPFDEKAAADIKADVLRAAESGKSRVYAERRIATGRASNSSVLHLRGSKTLADVTDPASVRRPATADALADAAATHAQGWLIGVGRASTTTAVSQGLKNEALAAFVKEALETAADGALDNIALGAARGGFGIGRLDAYREVDPEVKYYVRVEFDDDNTCDECAEHNGDMWETLEEALDDWPFIGADCEGGKKCRGDLVSVFADEGEVTSNQD